MLTGALRSPDTTSGRVEGIAAPTILEWTPRASGRLAPRRLATLTKAEWIAGAVALVLGLAHQLLLPNSGTDLAAQLARASFARSAPLTPVDLSWYSGVHPYGYSLLAPGIMAIFGVAATGLVAAVVSAVLFARLLRGLRFPVTAAVLGAVFSVADVVSGRTTFALSAVALVAALLLRERRGWAGFLAVLTALLSPVGAAFLALLAAVLVLHRRAGGWTLGVGAVIPTLALAILFPGGGIQPFSARSAVAGITVALVVAALTRVAMVRTGALLYAATVVAFFVSHSDPFGSNVLRLELLVAASVLLATHRRPSIVAVVAAVAVLCWQAGPLLADVGASPGPELHALTAQLVSLHSARVEVVAPREHRESVTVAEQVPLARGWGRQIDYRDNRLFYEGTLTGPSYLEWLGDHGVDHVAAPRRGAIDFGSTREARLLSHPVRGLTKVWSDRDWTVYRVDSPRPLAGAPVQVVSSTRTALTLFSRSSGPVRVLLRWSRWLTLSGPGCLARDGDQLQVRFATPGTVVVGSSLIPHGHC